MVNEEECGIGAGVIQGGVLSPTLFLIMFNDLLVRLEQVGIEAFAYADDLAAHGFDEELLNTAIKIIEEWGDENNMKINKKKSGIIFHMKRNSKRNIADH